MHSFWELAIVESSWVTYWLDRSGNQRCPWSPYAARSCQDSCPQKSTHCAPKISSSYIVSANCTQEHKVFTLQTGHKACTMQTTKNRLHTNCTQSRGYLAPQITKCTVEGYCTHSAPKCFTLQTYFTQACLLHNARLPPPSCKATANLLSSEVYFTSSKD